MAHYVSRLDQRTSETPKEWLQICSQIAEVVNEWSDRNDIVVYAGSDAGSGHTACYIKSVAEIEINLPVAFGNWATPEMVGDFRDRDTQFEWANTTGVIYHESLHAKHSNWDNKVLESMTENVFRVFQLLDEGRIERFGVISKPDNQVFLRSSALELALKELDENGVEQLSEVRACAFVCALAMARVDAGVLKLTDVRTAYDKILSILGQELFDKLRSIWYEFQRLHTDQIERGKELAELWVALLDEADPEPEKPTGGCEFPGGSSSDEDEDKGKGKGRGKGSVIDDLADDLDNSGTDVINDLNDQQTKEEQQKELDDKTKRSQRQSKIKNEASKVFTNNTGEGSGSRSSSVLKEKRSPTGKERANAVRLAQMLEKAKYRERSITEVKSVLPAGRLKTRIAIQNFAMKSKGIHSQLPAWQQTKRKHTDDPTLTIGVMVDISGSMGGAMESMATTAWVLSEAGKRVQARTAMVYFGQDVFPTLKLGQKLDQVSVWTAPDGTEVFGRAFEALDGHLNLTYNEGVRLLVVVSDGHYTLTETSNAKEAIKFCADNGVAVLWLSPQRVSAGRVLVGNNGVVVDNLDVNEIANVIGKSATEALLKVSGGM